ncbi:MAG TPA: InlB B-repeat-containing protein [Chitinispirillaceae bacterium]|nr:InlB B-repeat-containing protein [Chitinispirillaceae bacterium]
MKTRVTFFSISIIVIIAVITCNIVRDDPLDELGTSYIPPAILVDSTLSSILPDDTIHSDSGTFIFQNGIYRKEFRFKYPEAKWGEWDSVNNIHLTSLQDGRHTINVSSRYVGGETPEISNISFNVLTKGFRPSFDERDSNDTTIYVTIGDSVTLNVNHSMIDSVSLVWYKNGDMLPNQKDTILQLNIAQPGDTGLYYCEMSNRQGIAVSHGFKIIIKNVIPVSYYKVYYTATGADSGAAPQDTNLYVSGSSFIVKGNDGGLYRTNNTFTGWLYLQSGKSIEYQIGDTVKIDTTDLTLIPRWSENPGYSVQYHRNKATDGIIPVDTTIYKKGSIATVKNNDGLLQRKNFIFAGWSTDTLEQRNNYMPGDTIIIGESTIVLFAVWDNMPKFSITYKCPDAISGTVPEDESFYRTGETVVISGNKGNLQRDGYVFTGWTIIGFDKSKTYLADDTLIVGAASIELTGQWSAKPTYKVSYSSNGADSGEVPEDGNNYLSGKSATIKGNAGNLKKSGYNFAGWSMYDDGTGTIYQPDTIIEIQNANVTLYAIWTQRATFGVTYISESITQGIVPRDAKRYFENDSIIIASSGTLIKEGYTFDGWSTDSILLTQPLNPGVKITMGNNDIRFYAKWRLNRYEATFLSPEVNFSKKDSVNHGSFLTSPTLPQRIGYDFNGWYRDELFTELWEFSTSPVTKNITLYAKWTIRQYTVSFVTNTSVAVPAQTINHGKLVIPPDPSPTREGFDFTGWYIDSMFTKIWNFVSDTVVMNSTLYAKWSIKTYTVYFNTMGGTPLPNVSVNYNSSVKRPDSIPKLTGFQFVDWYADNGGTTLWNFTSNLITAPDTIFAKWKVITLPVTFLTSSGLPVPSTQTVNYGSFVTEPVTQPVRDGYNFKGWYKDLNSSSSWNFANNIVTDTLKLFAKWIVVDKPFEIAVWGNFAKGALSHTFDDCLSSGANHIVDSGMAAFDAKNIHMTLFVITNNLTSANWNALKAVFAHGHEIGSHSATHTSTISELGPAQQTIRTNITGERCISIAYPNCSTPGDSEVLKYYIAGRNCNGQVNSSTTPANFAQISAIGVGAGAGGYTNTGSGINAIAEQAVASGGWAVCMHHGIGSDTHPWAVTNLSAMIQHLEYLDTNRTRIWAETFGNVARYISERNVAVITTIPSSEKTISLSVTDALPDSIYNYPLSIQREIPSDWTTAAVTQNTRAMFDTIITIEAKKYIRFQAVPDGGTVIIENK